MCSDKSERKVSVNKKISLAIATMSEALNVQKPVRFPDVPSWMQPVERYGWDEDCGEHLNCVSFKETHFKTISAVHADCIVRAFRDSGVKYFVVYSGFSQLSLRLGRGQTECLAWEDAAKAISQVSR